MPSNLRKSYVATSDVHLLPSHLQLGDLGLLPVNAYVITSREPIPVDQVKWGSRALTEFTRMAPGTVLSSHAPPHPRGPAS